MPTIFNEKIYCIFHLQVCTDKLTSLVEANLHTCYDDCVYSTLIMVNELVYRIGHTRVQNVPYKCFDVVYTDV